MPGTPLHDLSLKVGALVFFSRNTKFDSGLVKYKTRCYPWRFKACVLDVEEVLSDARKRPIDSHFKHDSRKVVVYVNVSTFPHKRPLSNKGWPKANKLNVRRPRRGQKHGSTTQWFDCSGGVAPGCVGHYCCASSAWSIEAEPARV